MGPGGTRPPNLAQATQIFRVIKVHKLLNTGQLDTVVLLPNDEGPGPPNIFFLEPPLHIATYQGSYTGYYPDTRNKYSVIRVQPNLLGLDNEKFTANGAARKRYYYSNVLSFTIS